MYREGAKEREKGEEGGGLLPSFFSQKAFMSQWGREKREREKKRQEKERAWEKN